MSLYLIRIRYSAPKNSGDKATFVGREMEIVDDPTALEKAAGFMRREKMLDNSVIGVEVLKKDIGCNTFELVGEINLFVK